MSVSPLYIEIGLHYGLRGGEFERIAASACAAVVADFVECGLLERLDAPDQYGATLRATDGMGVWLKAICSVPFPVRGWVIPVLTPERGGDAS